MTDEYWYASLDRWKTTEPPERPPEPIEKYVCTVCGARGMTGVEAFSHHVVTKHAVRGKHWSASWPNARFSCCPHE
jgi:hypothetical protein